MISEAFVGLDAHENLPAEVRKPLPFGASSFDESSGSLASPELRADLLDFDAWGEILKTYGRTMRVAVALTDPQGCLLGECQNVQPVWKLFHDGSSVGGSGCPFCITNHLSCTAVAEALQSGRTVVTHDQAGLTHVAVPLFLGKQTLGAIIAGQVFDRFPEPLRLRHVAKEFGVPTQKLWDLAIRQRPVSRGVLRASGDLLGALGQAFLEQRYGAIRKAELAEVNARFRLLVEGVRDYALFTIDLVGRVTSWNQGAERMLGYHEAGIVGQTFSRIFTAEDIQNCMPEKQLHVALQTGRAEDEGWRIRENRQQFWANVSITPLLENAGVAHGFAIIMQDATERKKIALVLEEAHQERTRLQEKFLSHVSHELRTPLAAIYFFTTNVLDGLLGEMTPQQHEHLGFALDNVEQLKDMVNDLLDITRVETHKLTVEPLHVSPVKLITEALSSCRTNAATKGIALHSEVAPGLPFIWADPARVRQILINLIDNGIKFTPEGGTVTVEGRPFVEDTGFLRLSVRDTGCGISPENREVVFDRLAQVKSGADASRSGLGLGLFIARELVSRHGGQVWVESQLGQGSTFSFTLPVFSLAKLCEHVLTAPNLEGGFVTLIAVDVVAVEGATHEDILPEICGVLQRCIHIGQDMLLPSMSDSETVRSFFIVACADSVGVKVIAARIGRGLQTFDHEAKLEPVISSTTLRVPSRRPREEQISELAARIDQLVQAHLRGEERLK
jgi:PAS domain S-box-containing protein